MQPIYIAIPCNTFFFLLAQKAAYSLQTTSHIDNRVVVLAFLWWALGCPLLIFFWNFLNSLWLRLTLKISSPFWQWKTDFDYFKMPQKPRLSKNYSLMNRRKIRKTEPLLPVQVLRWMDRRSAGERGAAVAEKYWCWETDFHQTISPKR